MARHAHNWWSHKIQYFFRTLILCTALSLILGASGGWVWAGAAPSPSSVKVALEPQTASYSVISSTVGVSAQTTPFKNEPASSGKVFRGQLIFGVGPSNSIPFIWQCTAQKLLLDFNRNGNFTNGTNGSFSAQQGGSLSYQKFSSVPLVLNTASGRCPVQVDLDFYAYDASTICQMDIHTYWHGRVTLQGQDWQVGVIPTLAGTDFSLDHHLLLRPWAEWNQIVNAYDSSLNIIPFSPKLFLNGHAYEVNYRQASTNAEIKPELEFAEKSVALGELKITGQFIQRITLPSDTYLVVLDRPTNTVKIPVNRYYHPNVLVENGAVRAYASAPSGQRQVMLTVTEKTPATLAAGGPLTNSLSAARYRNELRVDYRLLGLGGMNYKLVNQAYIPAPEFTAFKGEKKITSINFTFG